MNDLVKVGLRLLGVFLLAVPILLGWGIWRFIQPITPLEKALALIVILPICGLIGVFSWVTGILLLVEE